MNKSSDDKLGFKPEVTREGAAEAEKRGYFLVALSMLLEEGFGPTWDRHEPGLRPIVDGAFEEMSPFSKILGGRLLVAIQAAFVAGYAAALLDDTVPQALATDVARLQAALAAQAKAA